MSCLHFLKKISSRKHENQKARNYYYFFFVFLSFRAFVINLSCFAVIKILVPNNEKMKKEKILSETVYKG